MQQADYYLDASEVRATWRGIGAARLGLVGEVETDAFIALLNNRTPEGEKLTPRDKADRIPMVDLTFNAPKSVSALWAVTQDARIEAAHRRAVVIAMTEVERYAETRVRQGSAARTNATRRTGNLIWAPFEHTMTRPVAEDGMPDPHLHTHAAVVNATWDEREQRFKALDFENLGRDHVYYEAIYQFALATELKRLGVEIERTPNGKWIAVSRMPATALETFSRRTAEIEAAAEERGVRDAESRAALAKLTRGAKRDGLAATRDELADYWRSRLSPVERRDIDRVVADAKQRGPVEATRTIAAAWEHGLSTSLERQSIASEKTVLAEALRYAEGDVSIAELKAAASLAPGLIRGQISNRDIVTTEAMLDLERGMIERARAGRSACKAMGHGDYAISKDYLNAGQRAAINAIWASRDRVMIVEGDAGVGKTAGVIAEAVGGAKAAGLSVATFAPGSGAVEELAREVDAPSHTVARLLVDETLQGALAHGLVLIDEAGQVGVREMARLLELADRHDWRLVLVGDVKQHGAVSAGEPMRLLQQRAGLHTARVSEIVRQSGAYKDAVEAIARGDIGEAWTRFDQMRAIIELPEDRRRAAAAADYLGEREAGRSVLVVTPTHREKNAVSALIRDGLRRRGDIGAEETEVLRLIDTRWVEAERADARRYEPGMVVKAFRDLPGGVKTGERLTVVARDQDQVTVWTNHGRELTLPLAAAKNFKVYRRETIALAPGDTVRIAEQAQTLGGERLRTGRIAKIDGFERDGALRLEGGAVIARDFGHLDYGYCSTSHAAQGRTVDTVIGSMSGKDRLALSVELFYVAASRGKKAVRLYVDKSQAMEEAFKTTAARASAIELVEGALDAKLRPVPPIDRTVERTSRLRAYNRHLQERRRREQKGDRRDQSEQLSRRTARDLVLAEHRGRVRDVGREYGD